MSAMKRPEEVSKTSHPMKTTLLGLAALLLAGGFAIWHLASWPDRFRYPGELNDVEGMRLVEMVHLRQGVSLYAPKSAERFDAAIYGPLYYLVGARLVDPGKPSFFRLRLLSLAATLGCAAACALLAYWLAGSYLAAALVPLIFFSYGFVTRHGLSARCDIVAVFLIFGGFLLAYKCFESRALYLAIPLMVLGLFYKQQYVAAPLAIILALLIAKRYRSATLFAALLGLGGLATLALLHFVVFRGQALLSHLFFYNLVGFSWVQFKYAGLMYLGVVLLVPVLLGLEFLRTHPNSLLLCYLVVSVVISLGTVGKIGSDSHYWFEPVMLISVLMGALVAERTRALKNSAEVIFLFAIALFFARFFTPAGPRPADVEADQAIQEYLRRHFAPGTLALSHYAGDLGRAGLELPISDFDQYYFLVSIGKFPEQELVDQLMQRRFGVIVLNFELQPGTKPKQGKSHLPRSWSEAILANYELAADLEMPAPERIFDDDRFHVWVPRESPPTPSSQGSR